MSHAELEILAVTNVMKWLPLAAGFDCRWTGAPALVSRAVVTGFNGEGQDYYGENLSRLCYIRTVHTAREGSSIFSWH